MCEFPEKDLISCQIHFITLGDRNINQDVERVLKIIADSKLEYEVSSMSTTIRGGYKEILNLLAGIMEYNMDSHTKFLITTTFSNTCGLCQ